MARSLTHPAERRQHQRWAPEAWPLDWLARLRPGRQVRLLNLSRGGALIETSHRLSPGGTAAFSLETGETRHSTRAAIVRCLVCEVRADGLLFRGALAFESSVPWLDIDEARPTADVSFAVRYEGPLACGTTQPQAGAVVRG